MLFASTRLQLFYDSARAKGVSWVFASLALLVTSSCSLLGEREPAPLSTRLQSSTGCLDGIGKHAIAFWDGTLQDRELKASTQCLKRAFKTLDEQVQGTAHKDALTSAEFHTFLNTFIVPKTQIQREVTQALLHLKSYILGGSPERWEKSDTHNLLNWVDTLDELGPEWAGAITHLRGKATPELWEELKELSIRTERKLLKLEEANASPRALARKDVELLLDEFLDRIDQSDIGSGVRLLGLDALEQATRFLTGHPSQVDALTPETRTLILRVGARSFPSLLGLSLTDDSIRSSELATLAIGSDAPPDELLTSRQRHRAIFMRDLLAPLAPISSSTGEAIPVKEILEWSKPWLEDPTFSRLQTWAPLLKELSIGGSPAEFTRGDIQHTLQLLPSLVYAAMRPGKERWRPQVLISAYLSGWSRIRETDIPGATPPPFSDSKILEAIQKLETLDPSYQLPESLSKSLPGALRLARFALEGVRNGATIEWERWLGLLRLAATLDGPLLELQHNPSRKLSLIRQLLDRTIENTRCADDCIPLTELHEFLREDMAGSPLADLSSFTTAKRLLLGGSEQFVTLEDFRKIQETLNRLSPDLLGILQAPPEELIHTWINHLEPILNEIAKNHANGIPLHLLDALEGQWLSSLNVNRIGVSGPAALPSLPRLLVQTLSGSQFDSQSSFVSTAAWKNATRKLKRILATFPCSTTKDLKVCFKEAINQPASWRALRLEIESLPLLHSNLGLPWPIIDAWIGHAARAGWTPADVSPQELTALIHVALESMNRIPRKRDTPVTQTTLHRLLETGAHLAPRLSALSELATAMRDQGANSPSTVWQKLESELILLQETLKNLQHIYPHGTGISLYAASRLVDHLPRQWLTLNREWIKNGLEPTFHRLWVCKAEEAFCPSGLIPLLDTIRVHVRGERLAADFRQTHPDADESMPPMDFLQRMTDFGKTLSDPLDLQTWNHWKAATANYPQVFQGDPEQAYFARANGIFESNSRIFFHFERFSDFFMRAYDYTGASTLVAAAPIRLRQFNEMADDFDDLAKAFSALESRTPSMAATRFREAGLFSFHGDGDDHLTVQEFTGYFALIWSSKTLVKTITNKLTARCETGDGTTDLINRPILKMPCFRAGFTVDYREEFLKYLPGLARDWATWSDRQKERYIEAMERTGREKGIGDDPIPFNDIDGIASLLQYMEALMLRFDEDQDGALDQAEVHRMFPNLRSTIEAAVRKQGSDSIADDPEWLESLFTWVLTRKSLPKGPLPLGFVMWHGAREDRKFKIRRYDAMIAISVLLGADPK
jgi:hypothetical protein